MNYSVPITSAPLGCSSIYRCPLSENGLMTAPPGMTSLLDFFNYIDRTHRDRPFLGTRTPPEGPYQWIKYSEVMDSARAFGSALIAKNLIPFTYSKDSKGLRFLGVYSKNRAEYIISDLAGILYDLTSVPIYDTLGPEALDFILKQTEMAVLICSMDNISKLMANGKLASIKTIISFDPVIDKALIKEIQSKNIQFFTMKDLIAFGKDNLKQPAVTKGDSVYVVSYTSGTTGNPKGAMMSHQNFLSLICVMKTALTLYPTDVYLSILPMAHLFERAMALSLMYYGCSIGFFNGDPAKIKDDFRDLRPTVMACVPRLLNRFYEGMMMNINALTGCKRWLVDRAIAAKLKGLKENNSITHCCYDRLVFKKMKEAFGGRLRLFIVGSAPTAKDVLDFLKIALCIPIQEGYGQTESTGASFALQANDHRGSGTVGGPTVNTEFKIEDIPEMHYSSKDVDEDNNPCPRGEMCIRGPGVFLGYYKDIEKTKEVIDEEGWLHTGDVVLLQRNGSIRIIDRKKNIFKLAQGEYIAPEKLEGCYGKSLCVSEIFVWGDSFQSYLVAIIVPNVEVIRGWARERGIGEEEMFRSKDIRRLVLEQLNKDGKEKGFSGFEMIKNVFLEKEPFINRGLLTTTFKMKRNEAKIFYDGRIKEMYKEGMLI